MWLIKRILVQISEAFLACLGRWDALIGRAAPGCISIEQLTTRRSDASTMAVKTFVLVDVRSDAECLVSMIPGAITRGDFERNIDQYRDKAAITYCTAGGRSYLYARKIAKKGITVLNLKCGILGWCNARLPLITPDGQPTNRVHIDDTVFPVPDDYEAVY